MQPPCHLSRTHYYSRSDRSLLICSALFPKLSHDPSPTSTVCHALTFLFYPKVAHHGPSPRRHRSPAFSSSLPMVARRVRPLLDLISLRENIPRHIEQNTLSMIAFLTCSVSYQRPGHTMECLSALSAVTIPLKEYFEDRADGTVVLLGAESFYEPGWGGV